MLPYYILLAVVMLLLPGYSKKPKKSWLPIILVFVIMTAFVGLRDKSVGTDTGNYVRGFVELTEEQIEDKLEWDNDPGFWLLNKWGNSYGDNYAILLCLIAAFAYVGPLLVMRKLSRNVRFSLFVYMALCYSTFCINAARQGIAVGFFMLSFQYIIKRNFLKYVFWVLVAAAFHKTVIVMLPLYFLFTMRYNFKTVTLMVIASILISINLTELLSLSTIVEERYILYSEESKGGGEMLTLFYVLMALYFINRRKYIDRADRVAYDSFLLMFMSGSIIYVLVISMGLYIEISRFASYLQVAAVFMWPMILSSRRRRVSGGYKFLIVLGHLGFMAIYLERMANLVPYLLNTTLFGK